MPEEPKQYDFSMFDEEVKKQEPVKQEYDFSMFDSSEEGKPVNFTPASSEPSEEVTTEQSQDGTPSPIVEQELPVGVINKNKVLPYDKNVDKTTVGTPSPSKTIGFADFEVENPIDTTVDVSTIDISKYNKQYKPRTSETNFSKMEEMSSTPIGKGATIGSKVGIVDNTADIPVDKSKKAVKYPGIEIPTVKGVNDSIPELKNYEGIIEGSDTAQKFVDLVKDKTYVLGAKGLGNYTTKDGKSLKTSPDEIDCSGAVCTVRNAQGMSYKLTMTNAAKFKRLAKKTNIPVDESVDGDLILMNTEGKKIDHIGFVVIDKYGDRFLAESSSSYGGTTITPFNERIKDLQNRKPDFTFEIVSDK